MVLSMRLSFAHPIMSLFSAPTTWMESFMRRANSRAPRSPDSSPVNETNITVAGSGRLASTRAASRIMAVPEVLSSAPGPSARESKCAPTT